MLTPLTSREALFASVAACAVLLLMTGLIFSCEVNSRLDGLSAQGALKNELAAIKETQIPQIVQFVNAMNARLAALEQPTPGHP